MCLQQDNNEESKNAKMKSSKIEQDLYEQARSEVNVVKILMLGELNYGFCVHHKHFLSNDKQWMFLRACQGLRRVARAHCSNRSRLFTVTDFPIQSSSASRYWLSTLSPTSTVKETIWKAYYSLCSRRCLTTCWCRWSLFCEEWGCWGLTWLTRTTR